MDLPQLEGTAPRGPGPGHTTARQQRALHGVPPGGRRLCPRASGTGPGLAVAPGLGGERQPQLVPMAREGAAWGESTRGPEQLPCALSADAPAAWCPHRDPGACATRGSAVGARAVGVTAAGGSRRPRLGQHSLCDSESDREEEEGAAPAPAETKTSPEAAAPGAARPARGPVRGQASGVWGSGHSACP